MSKDLINRVEKSNLISIDLEDYFLSGKRYQIDLKNWRESIACYDNTYGLELTYNDYLKSKRRSHCSILSLQRLFRILIFRKSIWIDFMMHYPMNVQVCQTGQESLLWLILCYVNTPYKGIKRSQLRNYIFDRQYYLPFTASNSDIKIAKVF